MKGWGNALSNHKPRKILKDLNRNHSETALTILQLAVEDGYRLSRVNTMKVTLKLDND